MASLRSVLGIDLKTTTAKAVEVESNGAGAKLKSFGIVEIPPGTPESPPEINAAKAEALRQLLQEGKFSARDAVLVASGGEGLIKLFSLPDIPPAEIGPAIKWKFAEEASFPMDDALIDYYPAASGSYVAACLPRKFYLESEAILSKAGLKISGITVQPLALREVFKDALTNKDERVVSIVYMGKKSTGISIFKEGEFEFYRELNVGGENITQAMAGTFIYPEGKIEVSPAEAEKIKLEHGVPVDLENYPKLGEIPLVQLQAMVRPVLEKILSEIGRTFEYYKDQAGEGAVSKIIFTGSSALTPHLKEFLSAGLGLPVDSPAPHPGLNHRISSAYGAALPGSLKINLIPEEIKNQAKPLSTRLQRPEILVGGFAGLLAIIYLFVWLQAFGLQRDLNYMARKLTEYKARLVRFEAIEKSSKEKEQKKLNLAAMEKKRTKALRVLDELGRLAPASGAINSLNLSAGNFRLQGIIFKKGEAAESILSRFVSGISSYPLFEGTRLVQANKNNDFSVEALNFEISGRIKVD